MSAGGDHGTRLRLGAAASRRQKSESERGLREHVVEGFGQLLRHELNNPLMGILGNAELLLPEVQRNNDWRLLQGGQKRLEAIAALAVPFRKRSGG